MESSTWPLRAALANAVVDEVVREDREDSAVLAVQAVPALVGLERLRRVELLQSPHLRQHLLFCPDCTSTRSMEKR
jgi:hypothetical protein